MPPSSTGNRPPSRECRLFVYRIARRPASADSSSIASFAVPPVPTIQDPSHLDHARVIPPVAKYLIVARPAIEDVVARAAVEHVVATHAQRHDAVPRVDDEGTRGDLP